MSSNFNLANMEKRYITEALIRTKNIHHQASNLLGISIRTLSRKKAEHKIDNELIYELIDKRKNRN